MPDRRPKVWVPAAGRQASWFESEIISRAPTVNRVEVHVFGVHFVASLETHNLKDNVCTILEH